MLAEQEGEIEQHQTREILKYSFKHIRDTLTSNEDDRDRRAGTTGGVSVGEAEPSSVGAIVGAEGPEVIGPMGHENRRCSSVGISEISSCSSSMLNIIR